MFWKRLEWCRKMKASELREGMILKSTKMQDMLVTRIINWQKCEVEFQDEHKYKKITSKNAVLGGHVKNPYHKSVYSVGFVGVGKFGVKENKKAYVHWNSMLERCYSAKHPAFPNYGGRGVSVCEEWHNFQNFAEWCNRQKGFESNNFHLDKDLLKYFNKVYSPESCAFLPKEINLSLNTGKRNSHGLPTGVTKSPSGRFRACANGVKLGHHATPKEAFVAYKKYRESRYKELAVKYRKLIDQRVFERLMQLKVDPLIPTGDYRLDIISYEHFKKIKETGYMYEFYPDLPLTWEETKKELEEKSFVKSNN